MRSHLRAMVMFVIACFASPCCTPLYVPVLVALLAGTPVAAWMGRNLGWVYGGLMILSAVSLVLGLRWMRQRPDRSINVKLFDERMIDVERLNVRE